MVFGLGINIHKSLMGVALLAEVSNGDFVLWPHITTGRVRRSCASACVDHNRSICDTWITGRSRQGKGTESK